MEKLYVFGITANYFSLVSLGMRKIKTKEIGNVYKKKLNLYFKLNLNSKTIVF